MKHMCMSESSAPFTIVAIANVTTTSIMTAIVTSSSSVWVIYIGSKDQILAEASSTIVSFSAFVVGAISAILVALPFAHCIILFYCWSWFILHVLQDLWESWCTVLVSTSSHDWVLLPLRKTKCHRFLLEMRNKEWLLRSRLFQKKLTLDTIRLVKVYLCILRVQLQKYYLQDMREVQCSPESWFQSVYFISWDPVRLLIPRHCQHRL